MLREYLNQFEPFARLPVSIRWAGEAESVRLSPSAQVQLLRIIQEALSNVRRHAQATQVEVIFTPDGRDLVVEIRDNGQGFDPEAQTAVEWPTFGLQSMRERAESAGGSLTIRSAPTLGTTVTVRLPAVPAAGDAAPAQTEREI